MIVSTRLIHSLRHAVTSLALVSAVALAGCGGGGGGGTTLPGNNSVGSGPVSVRIANVNASLVTGGSQAYSATVQNSTNASVTWSVEEGSTGGTITPAGLYTAPNVPGTYHIVATSVADPSKSDILTVTVSLPVSVAISPTSPTVHIGASQTFSAVVKNTTNPSVTWTVQEGAVGGSITPAAVYTAPKIAGTYHIIATSQADTTKTASSAITVLLNVSVQPSAMTMSILRSLHLTATVTGTANITVQWSVQEPGGGSITTSGDYTAPNAAGVYHVTAKSAADPTQSSTATVTVQASGANGIIQ